MSFLPVRSISFFLCHGPLHFPEEFPVVHLLTAKELSHYLKLHEVTIYKYASRGEIPSFKIGREWRFDKDVVDAWIRGGKEKQAVKEQSGKKKVGRQPLKYRLRKKKD